MAGFKPPPYPYDRLKPLAKAAEVHEGGAVNLSVGTPNDPPPQAVLEALADSDAGGVLRGYPTSVGSKPLREGISSWLGRRFGADVDADSIGVCVGTKEFVASLPHFLALRTPGRDTVLYPAVSYPTYAMGATLAGLRAVPVPVDSEFRLDLSAVAESDVERALLLWVNSPGNPAGAVEDLDAAAAWGRHRGIFVASDECYADFTWSGKPQSILGSAESARPAGASAAVSARPAGASPERSGSAGAGASSRPAGAGASPAPGASSHEGVLALHSLSKRSNLAGLRLGWYAGDEEVVYYLREVRKHAGMMVPGPMQRAGLVALEDEHHVDVQREVYRERMELMRGILAKVGIEVDMPGGGFYLWAPAPNGDSWVLAERLAHKGGALVSPGDFYGPDAGSHVRIALVQPVERIELVARRLGVK